MKKILLLIINLYKIFISPLLFALFGYGCKFEVSCSEYAKKVIKNYGAGKGTLLAIKRLSKCHPFSKTEYITQHTAESNKFVS